jgi:hypothetical protein
MSAAQVLQMPATIPASTSLGLTHVSATPGLGWIGMEYPVSVRRPNGNR